MVKSQTGLLVLGHFTQHHRECTVSEPYSWSFTRAEVVGFEWNLVDNPLVVDEKKVQVKWKPEHVKLEELSILDCIPLWIPIIDK